MTGGLARMDLPHIADRRARRAGWDATVKVSGVDLAALAGTRQTVVADAALSKAAHERGDVEDGQAVRYSTEGGRGLSGAEAVVVVPGDCIASVQWRLASWEMLRRSGSRNGAGG